MTKSLSEQRAMSEASGRERSQARCDACRYWSDGARCQRATSKAYSLKTAPEAYCYEFEKR